MIPRSAGPAVLRRFTAADLPRFHAYRSDAEVGRFQGWSAMSEAEALAFIDEMAVAQPFVAGSWFQLAIADAATDELVGDLGLYLSDSGEVAEVGFTLSLQARGRGYATAAVREVVGLFFEHTGVGRVLGVTDARNTPSVGVLERSGFRRIQSREVVFKGEPCTEWVYARDRSG